MTRKLLLLGNGFDLAHGLETSYSQFIDYVIRNHSAISGFVDSPFIEINAENALNLKYINHGLHSVNPKNFIDQTKKIKNQKVNFKVNDFLVELLAHQNEMGWVNIEKLYFEELLKCFYQNQSRKGILECVSSLNKSLSELKQQLHNYIAEINKKSINPFMLSFLELWSLLGENVKVVNFNYTNTASQYFGQRVNNIHGLISSNSEPEDLVFGYGDENHPKYQEIVDFDDNSTFAHMKSFRYLKNELYQELNTFINGSEKYDVHIIGLSCGLSDRTLLNQVFHNKNCSKILIHAPFDMNNYLDIAMNISRHFENHNDFRTKVASFKEKMLCPQMS